MLHKTKKYFFGQLDDRVVSDYRKFRKTVGPLFSWKAFHKESIILNNNNKTISNNEELAEVFNKNFSKLVANLDIDNIAQTLPILFLMLLKSTNIIQVLKKLNISWAVKISYTSRLFLKHKTRF